MIIAISGLTEDEQGNTGSAGAGKSEVAKRLVEKHGFVEIAFADEIKRTCMRLWDFTEEQLWGDSRLRNLPDERYQLGFELCCGCTIDKWEKRDGGFWVHHVLEYCAWEKHEENWFRGRIIMPDHAEGKSLPKQVFLTPRHALQSIGEAVNQADPLAWTRFAMNAAKQLLGGNRNFSYSNKPKIVSSVSYDKVFGVVSHILERGDESAPEVKGVVISDLRHLTELGGVQEVGGKCWRKKRNVATLSGAHGKHASEVGLNDVPDEKFDGVFPDSDLNHLHLLIDSCMDIYTGRIISYDPAQVDVPPFLRK